MKKQILAMAVFAAGLMILGSGTAKAQATQQVIVNVDLKETMGIFPGTGGTSIPNFEFQNAEDYTKAQDKEKDKQLQVVSTEDYKITVRAETPTFNSTQSAATLPLNILTVAARQSNAGSFQSSITPTTTDQVIFTGGKATIGEDFDFSYIITPNQTMIEAPKELYNVTLTYTVSAE
ncbi:hypothetical protein [Chitinophaga sp. Cy-1792]|uniref:hypothetical protein n=1 Tax=Chitinophaga sp. Cy-1792 TaxID=2608339 RepID=UPI0014220C66|nr:hypothetical protein [Chitinophaga sp. Cy-1792]NIG55658.1 hypothetical protein [Chitinophaga sp. Cy-1792]